MRMRQTTILWIAILLQVEGFAAEKLSLLDKDGVGNPVDYMTLIAQGADVGESDNNGNTPVFHAAFHNNHEAVQILIDAGARLDVRNKLGQTPLLALCTNYSFWVSDGNTDRLKTLQVMLKAGAEIDAQDGEGRTPLMHALLNISGSHLPHRTLLKSKPDVSILDNAGRNALFYSSGQKKETTAQLLKMGADLHVVDKEGINLLMVAASDGDLSLLNLCLESGINAAERDNSGETAVHKAMSYNSSRPSPFSPHIEPPVETILDLLVKNGAELDTHSNEGVQPVHHAAGNKNVQALTYLLENKCDPNASDIRGETPVLLAVRSGDPKTVETLLKAGALPYSLDHAGDSPLLIAVKSDNIPCAQLLADAGAKLKPAPILSHELLRVSRRFHDDPITPSGYGLMVKMLAEAAPITNESDKDGMTPLMWVAASNNLEALQAVMNRKPELNLKAKDGRTALMWAASTNATHSMELLRKAGANETITDNEGKTVADWQAWFQKIANAPSQGLTILSDKEIQEKITQPRQDALKAYIRKGGWKKTDRIFGATPLQLASAIGSPEDLRKLIALGANPNAQDNASWTALHFAAEAGNTESIRLLLKNGANRSLRNEYQKTPADLAHDAGHQDAETLLRDFTPPSQKP